MDDKIYDLIIVGSGPAGLTAGIYAARYTLDTLIIGSDVGGTANLAHDLENWPGYKGPGMVLMQNFKEHVESFGVPVLTKDIKSVLFKDNVFEISTDDAKFRTHTIILAMGTKRRKLDVPGEDEYFGRGVSYCATCDCVFFKDKIVGVVGGSDSAAMAAQILTQHAKKVIIIYRKGSMRAEPARVIELEKEPKVEFMFNTNISRINGQAMMTGVEFDDGTSLDLDGLFIEIGGIPVTAIAKELGIRLANNDRIEVDSGMATSIPGIFAAGDITTGSNQFNQIVTAAAEGAIAALGCFKHVRKKKLR